MSFQVVRSTASFAPFRGSGLALVPTMGALHEGHAKLIREASASSQTCVVSIFVNPTQFGPGEDFERYPRREEEDFEICREAGAKVVFCPTVQDMYKRKTTTIHVKGLTELWEGAHRPGHFDGVATVVAKLFHIVDPDTAYFGLKDFQQCAVIQRMVEDLDMRVGLRFVETVREADGLALSSRNQYLNSQERQQAPALYATLVDCADQLNLGDASEKIESVLRNGTCRLERNGFEVDYLSLVDIEDLNPITQLSGPARLLAAARLGSTRLIDNISV